MQAEGLDGPGRTAWPGRRAVPGSRAGQGQAGPVWSGPVQALDERVRRGGADSAGSRTVSPENPSPTLRGRFCSLAALVKTTPRVEGGPAPSQCGLLLGLFPGGGLVTEYFDRSVSAAAAATTLGARRQSRIESSSRFTGNGIWRPDREGLFQPMPLKCHPNCDPIRQTLEPILMIASFDLTLHLLKFLCCDARASPLKRLKSEMRSQHQSRHRI